VTSGTVGSPPESTDVELHPPRKEHSLASIGHCRTPEGVAFRLERVVKKGEVRKTSDNVGHPHAKKNLENQKKQRRNWYGYIGWGPWSVCTLRPLGGLFPGRTCLGKNRNPCRAGKTFLRLFGRQLKSEKNLTRRGGTGGSACIDRLTPRARINQRRTEKRF